MYLGVIQIKILNFGSCNIDYVYSLDHIVRIGETQSTHKLELFPGGKGLNQSIAISRAGCKVFHAGCIGYDGKLLIDTLSENGVDISYVRSVDEKNGHAVIQVSDKGENSIFLYGGSNEAVTESFIDEVLLDFSDGDILVLQNEITNVPYLVKKAYAKGMQIVFNPSPFDESLKKIDLSMLSYLVLNEIESFELSGYEAPETALSYFKDKFPDLKIIITLGGEGSIYGDSEQQIYQRAFMTDVVDTTAAGDTFTGYFVAGLALWESVARSLEMASAAASIAVSKKGAAPSIPYRGEVDAALQRPRYKNETKKELAYARIMAYVRDNTKDGSLAELAKILNYSVVYTGTLVKKYTDKTFSELLQAERLALAAELLKKSTMSVSDIITHVGYENRSFFRRKFKEIYGFNPLEYRNMRD